MHNNDSLLNSLDVDLIPGAQFKVGGYLAEVVNGWAAGTLFWQLKFLEGPWTGLAAWFEADEDGFVVYEENIGSDGFGFNWVDTPPSRIDSPVEGDLLPIPSGTFLTLEAI